MRDALYATLNGTKENRKNTRKAAENIGSCGPQLTPDVGARQCISGAAVMIAVIPTITLKAKQSKFFPNPTVAEATKASTK